MNGIEVKILSNQKDWSIDNIQFDSRLVNDSSVFVAIKGSATDGHAYVEAAHKNGCRAFVVQDQIKIDLSNSVVYQVSDTSKSLAEMSSNFYGNPSSKLKLIGVTGTNGKTTCCTLLFDLFESLGYKSGLISTVINRIGSREIKSTHTTPDPIQLNGLLAKMVELNCEYCFMEVSSHAIHQNRIHGLNYVGAAFTNITHDHLDYHKNFKEYISVKKQFFDGLSADAFALSNADDKNGAVMLQNTMAKKEFYALNTHSDYKGKIIENSFSGLHLIINGKELYTNLVGSFNASNILAIYGVAVSLGLPSEEVLRTISKLKAVDGRFECIKSSNEITAIIDYAHTPDALKNILNTINDIKMKDQNIISVVGCGGDRDKEKRPIMASLASKVSQTVILTSDNPRSEDPQSIIDDMERGVDSALKSRVIQVLNRAQAIKTAVKLAQKRDVILIAGKGHEKYQEIQGIRYDFDDVQIVKEMFNQIIQ